MGRISTLYFGIRGDCNYNQVTRDENKFNYYGVNRFY